ncbi:hypothetical protein FAM21834_01140 [Lentilactobacillus parabuchneri]|uniref:hypothetical protein n=1 Tax=Lentilactobacillus parabuchneri TaxID=152331 RepID=UPI000A10FE5F|nr:hypothetical protein [Lentilactobacillus parabuchneri]ORN10629.1 hypothetical protein FAM21834_01140 [Lentilactobacillus parabuchneri]
MNFEEPKISLTQFLTFNSCVSTNAKISTVRKIKNQPDYNPSFDYWKKLRDGIKRCLKQGKPIESLLDLADSVTSSKRPNYLAEAKRVIAFFKDHDVEYFETEHASWGIPGTIEVSASPELGLKIDGQKYLLKLYYKLKDKKQQITYRNIRATLALMSLANHQFLDDDAKVAVLNLQNGKIILAQPISEDDKIALKINAQTFANIWSVI